VPSREVADERHRWLVSAVLFYDPDGIKLEIVHVPER
jgi:hypothetical protein